jgi:hypothetical protein
VLAGPGDLQQRGQGWVLDVDAVSVLEAEIIENDSGRCL